MIDRNLYNLRRMRRYTDPFEDDGETSEREGLRQVVRPVDQRAHVVHRGFRDRGPHARPDNHAGAAGRPRRLAARRNLWFEIGFLAGVLVMSFLSCSMFVCGSHRRPAADPPHECSDGALGRCYSGRSRGNSPRRRPPNQPAHFVARRCLGYRYRRLLRALRDHFGVSLGRHAGFRGEHGGDSGGQFRVELAGRPAALLHRSSDETLVLTTGQQGRCRTTQVFTIEGQPR